jgi:ATP-dependent DNA helicase RecG
MDKTELLRRLSDIEWDDFEVKEARTELPKSIWETVSAFANSSGGWIVLGVSKKGRKFDIKGVENTEKQEQDFTTVLRSHSKFNVLINPRCLKYNIDGKTVLAFFIPSSEQKPVYFNSLTNTFVRTGSGDQRATDSEINALLREQSFGIRSDLIVDGSGFSDLNKSSMETYRNRVKNQNPQMIYNDLSDVEFCEKLGVTKNGTLTYGGLLVLGKANSIRQKFNDFWVDYLEIPGVSYSDAKTRYTFRIQEQENLWEYYNVLIQRLRNYADNPFKMGDNGFAYEDDTQLDALREGLVNMLMHADYFGVMHSAIRVFNNRIVFQNPGRFDINISQWQKTAISKPRNPVIARMFRWAKLAENAGFGYDKMLAWKHKVEFVTYIDYSEATFYLTEKVAKNIISGKITEGVEITPPITPPITDLERKLLDIIWQNPKGSREEFAGKLGISTGVVKEYINRLKQKGVLKRQGNNRTGYWEIKNIQQ